MPQQPPNLADQWSKLNPQQRQLALSKMPPEQREQLASSLGFQSQGSAQPKSSPAPRQPSSLDLFLRPANEKASPESYDPNTLRGYGARVGEAGKGVAASIKGLLTPGLPGVTEPVIWNPVTQVKKDWQGIKDWNELRKVNPDYAWGSILGPMLLTHVVSGLMEPAGMPAKLARGAGVDPAYTEPVVADLRTAAKTHGAPKTVGDFVDLSGKAEKTLNDEYGTALGRYAHYRSNLPNASGQFPLAERIRELKNNMPDVTNADRAERAFVDQAAAEYQKPISLGQLDLKRKQANNRLDAYYNKSDVGQYAAETKNAQIAVDRAVADWVRDTVYPEMDQLTGKPPGYFRNLKSRIGNLMNASSQAKEFASKVHRESAVERGSTPIERVHPGGAISLRGAHGYLSNLPAALRAPNPEGAAGSAVRSAFSARQKLPAPRKVSPLSLPLSAITGASNAGAENPTDAWANQ